MGTEFLDPSLRVTVNKMILACRPHTLIVGIAPVIVGNTLGIRWRWDRGYEDVFFSFFIALLSIFFVMVLQSAANLVNDAKDFESGVDHDQRLGPRRFAQSGEINLGALKIAYRLLLGLGMVLGLGLLSYGDWPVALIAGFSGLFAYLYTGGPFPLSHHGMGEVVALIFFGPVAVGGTFYLQTLHWESSPAFWGLGPGFIAAAIMAINNCRDRVGDSQAGKKTLAVLLGKRFSRQLPGIFLVLSLLILLHSRWQPGYWLPAFGMVLVMLVYVGNVLLPLISRGTPNYNLALKKTTQFLFLYSIILSLCLW